MFGAPTRVIADQGRCFTSNDFKTYCNSKNINLHLIATGASRANGQVERVMSVLKAMLTAIEITPDKSWQNELGNIQLAINCTINKTTKTSPLELLIGKVARPLAMMVDNAEHDVDLNLIRQVAIDRIQKSAKYEKARFDKTKAKIKRFSLGEFGLIQNEERNQTKLEAKYKGPYEIIEVLENDRYKLKSLSSKRTYKYAHDRLRKMPDAQVAAEELLGNTT